MAEAKNRQTFPTITQAFLYRVKNQPDKQTFHYKTGTTWTPLTWKEYYEKARLVAAGLASLGVRPGENICVLSNTRLEWTITDMAVLGNRCVTVPIYASNTAEDSAFIINHCEARFLFVEDQRQLEKIFLQRELLLKLEKIIVFSMGEGSSNAIKNSERKDVLSYEALCELGKRALTKDKALASSFDRNLTEIKSNDVFTICYTSGTTGVPKGVVLTHDSLTSVLNDVDAVVGESVGENDVVLSFLPISHIFGKIESMAVYHFNWNVYYAESIEKVFPNIGEVRPTLLFAVPRIFEKAYAKIKSGVDDSSPLKRRMFALAMAAGTAYYQKIWKGQKPTLLQTIEYEAAKAIVFRKIYAKFGGRLRICIAGGAPLSKEIGEFMQIIGVPVLEGYGLTETCAPVTLNPLGRAKYGSIGRPLPEVAMKIADDGEILVKSRKVFKEYYKNPEATHDSIDTEGWFHTGDIGIINGEGYVRITDRKKDLIITSGGKNVAPQKIENLAKNYKFVSQFMVYGDQRNFLSALVVLDKEEVVKYANANNILFSEYSELVKNPKIQALVQDVINQVNSHLASYESIKRFKIVPTEFTVETGELTPSMKIRRRFCNEKYKQELDALYGGPTV